MQGRQVPRIDSMLKTKAVLERTNWEKVDIDKYREETKFNLETLMNNIGSKTHTDVTVTRLNDILYKSGTKIWSQEKRNQTEMEPHTH